MTQKAKVISVSGNYAVIRVSRKTMCEGCHNSGSACSVCMTFGAKDAECTALNAIKAKVGDTVIVNTRSSLVIGHSALVFMLPIILSLAVYFVTSEFHLLQPIVWAIVTFVASFSIFCILLDRKIKKNPEVEIISYASDDVEL